MMSEYFIFDGIKSTDMNLYIVRMGDEFATSPFLASSTITEEKAKKRDNVYFFGVDRENLEFKVDFTLIDKYGVPIEWTPEERYKIGRWLVQNEYKEFQTADDLGKRYFAMVTDVEPITMAGNGTGYFSVTFQTNSPYAWTFPYVDYFNTEFDGNSIVVENRSNLPDNYAPKIEIKNNDTKNATITLTNNSNGGKKTIIGELLPGEVFSIDNQNRFVKSSRSNKPALSKFNREWFELTYGQNFIEIEGKCEIWFKSEFPIIQ